MKNKEQRNLDFWIPFFPWGILLLMWTLFFGLFCFVTGPYILAFIHLVLFAMLGLEYGRDYCYPITLFLNYKTKKINKTEVANDTDDIVLESIHKEKAIESVDVKFNLSEFGSKNTFLQIKIPSSFIGEFKKYNPCLNSPSILCKKIYEWGECDNGMCTQNILCFSKAEIKSTIEQVTSEVHAAIEWLPNENGDQSICTQKWVKFEWK